MTKIPFRNADGVEELLDPSECMVIKLAYRKRDVIALEDVLRILSVLSKAEAQRVVSFAADVVEQRSS